MAASLLGTGGYATVPNTVSANSPAVLYDAEGKDRDADQGACNAYQVVNTDTTNWLWIRIVGVHKAGQGIPVLPGQIRDLVYGFNWNGIAEILAWATAPASASAVSLVVAGGIVKKS